MLPSSVTDEYGHAGSSTPTPHKRLPWNKGNLTGAKPPLRPKHVWSVWTTFQIEGRARDLTMFNLAIDSKLRGSNLAHERPLCAETDLLQMWLLSSRPEGFHNAHHYRFCRQQLAEA
jgi:hypothetical protein